MTDWHTVLLVVAAYLGVSLGVGLLAGSRSTDTVAGYVAGDRDFGTLVMYFVTGATVFSAFAFLGGPGWAYSRGAAAFYILAYGVLGIAPTFALGPWAARLGRKHGYVTQASMLAHRFQSRRVAVVAGVVSVIAMVPYVALQMRGAGILLEQVTDGRIPLAAGSAIAYTVVLIYVWRSGVMGVGWTNVFQGVFMITIAWTLGFYIPHKLYGGIGPMFEQLEALRPELLTTPGLDAAGNPWSPGAYTSAILVSAIGFMMWPHLFMKAFAAKDDATIRRTVVLFPTFQLFLFPLFVVGFAGVMYGGAPDNPDAIMPHIVLTSGLPALVVGLFCAGALAASMSTGDALVHGAASIAVEDVYGGSRGSELSQHDRRTLIRWLAIAVGIFAYVIALWSGRSLVGLLLAAYGAVVQLAPAVYGAFLWRRATATGAVAGLLVGAAVTGLLVVRPQWRPLGIHEGIVGLVANLATFIVVSLATRPPDANHVAAWHETCRSSS
ncbi:MAG: sodium:solute symporter family protein [Gemmatimonadales bacterium]|nr:sodium:solute symporter family protein [Gemmatimonadales bacterium]NIN10250.1 sodium:solute symporter family protein [Gemmatimonadales bacterium]NIN49046.1 sodium:solute symporter family protein [Gemmatimonadales bacterium]NIP06510.1 sodium:solute symporter family protein [Gemmatimonadales bacterium]NIQ98853.1 sodium:solute symporter family protein [Gemmatimonadales bacterium]